LTTLLISPLVEVDVSAVDTVVPPSIEHSKLVVIAEAVPPETTTSQVYLLYTPGNAKKVPAPVVEVPAGIDTAKLPGV
jgi:hypothetical protein